jgi:transglycosylase-like protein with SLT domain
MVIKKYEDYLFEQLINEEINWSDIKDKFNIDNMFSKLLHKINNTKNLKEKIRLITIIVIILGTYSINGIVKLTKDDIKDDKSKVVIEKLAKKEIISQHDIINNINYIDHILKSKDEQDEKQDKKQDIVKIDTTIINGVNKIKPNLLSDKEMDIYNKHDEDIILALKDLEKDGEKPDFNLVKSIMIIETGMKPKKNKLGYEGFPQTKQKWINWINKKYKTNFTMADMYNPHESAKFIHYYIKALNKSKFVNDSSDLVIAYNWGTTNLIKYKQGSKELPKESKDYVDMLKVITQNT